MADGTCTKTLQNSKISWPGLPEDFSFALCISNDDSSLSKKCSFSSARLILSKKPPVPKYESFLKLNFEIKQTSKIVFTQNH